MLHTCVIQPPGHVIHILDSGNAGTWCNVGPGAMLMYLVPGGLPCAKDTFGGKKRLGRLRSYCRMILLSAGWFRGKDRAEPLGVMGYAVENWCIYFVKTGSRGSAVKSTPALLRRVSDAYGIGVIGPD